MSKQAPDHHDAEIVLRLYDLRRESVMRQSRSTLAQWLPKSWEDVLAIAQPTDPRNAAWRQVSSYFEMAYGMARHGIVHADFLAESTGEGLFLFAKIEPHLARLRKELSPLAFRNAEWMVANSEAAKRLFELFQGRVRKLLEAR